MSRKPNHLLEICLATVFTIWNPVSHGGNIRAENQNDSLQKKSEPRKLPSLSSPIELRRRNELRPREIAPRGGNETRTSQSNPAKAQSIPSTIGQNRTPALRQVAGPATQNPQYRQQPAANGNYQSSSIQQQLDQMYREQGLQAPVMQYDALPVQGVEDYQSMQQAHPQQTGANPYNGSNGNSAEQAYGRTAENPQPASWLQKIFGRRPKPAETPRQNVPPQGIQQPNMQHPSQVGQYQAPNTQNQIPQTQNNQYRNNSNQYEQQQFGNQQQFGTEGRNFNSVQTQQNNGTANSHRQPRNAPTDRQPGNSVRDLDYSRLKNSLPREESIQTGRTFSAGSPEEEPEESLEFDTLQNTPRLESNARDSNEFEAPEEQREPNTAGTHKPSPFDNLELHTPDEAAEAGNRPDQPHTDVKRETPQSPENSTGEDFGQEEYQQAPANPLIVPENGPLSSSAEPIIGIDDAELAAKYRILAAFPELEGMKGFCPVALRDERDLVRAKRIYSVPFENRNHYFSSSDAMIKFRKDPKKYLPVAEGNDVVLLSHREEVLGTLDFAAWYQGRLYLFTSLENLETFVNRPAHFERIALGTPDVEENDLQEPEESLEFESPREELPEDLEAGTPREDTSNRSPSEALRGPPLPNRSLEKINVPPPPRDSDEVGNRSHPGSQRHNSGLSRVSGWKAATHKVARR